MEAQVSKLPPLSASRSLTFGSAMADALSTRDGGARIVRVIARSPGAKGVQAVLSQLHSLKTHDIELQAIFLKMPERGPGSAILRRLGEVYGANAAQNAVRILEDRLLSNSFEMIIFGTGAVWTGHRMTAWFSARPEDGFVAQAGSAAAQAVQTANYLFDCNWRVAAPFRPSQLDPEHLRLTSTR